jgi:TonB family protein
MTHLLVLCFALFAAQATTPATPPPSANPDASGVYQVGGSVKGPIIIYQPEPTFPEEARKAKFYGTPIVSFMVDEHGKPQNVHVIHSVVDSVDQKYREAALALEKATVDSVKQYRFKPAMKDGKPVAVYLNMEINIHSY